MSRDLEAYDHLVRARNFLYRFTVDSMCESRQALERALELDPELAQAYATLSLVSSTVIRQRLEPVGAGHPAPGHGTGAEGDQHRRRRTDGLPRARPIAHLDAARQMWREVREINPDYSVAHIRRVLPYRDPAWFDHFTEGLEKAGLPG